MRLVIAFGNLVQLCTMASAGFYTALTQTERSLHILATLLTATVLLSLLHKRKNGQVTNLGCLLLLLGLAIEGSWVASKSLAADCLAQIAFAATAAALTAVVLMRRLLTAP